MKVFLKLKQSYAIMTHTQIIAHIGKQILFSDFSFSLMEMHSWISALHVDMYVFTNEYIN